MNIPANTSYVQVTGSLSAWGKYWAVDCTPLPPLMLSGDLAYDGNAPYEIPAVLFTMPLDPTVKYNASVVVGDDPVAMQLGVSRVSFWSL